MSPLRRSVTWALLALTLAHSAAVMLWIMPPSNPIRAAVGNERLADYVMPFFQQNWSVFAPSPGVNYSSMSIRAYVGEPNGKGELTEWVDVSRKVDRRLLSRVAPSRMQTVGRRLADGMTAQLNAMSEQQRDLVLDNYWATSTAALGNRLEKASAGYDADGYLLQEARLTTFATLAARALWGDEVSVVQFKVAVHEVPSYSERRVANDDAAPTSETLVGWRAAEVESHDTQQAFDEYIEDGF